MSSVPSLKIWKLLHEAVLLCALAGCATTTSAVKRLGIPNASSSVESTVSRKSDTASAVIAAGSIDAQPGKSLTVPAVFESEELPPRPLAIRGQTSEEAPPLTAPGNTPRQLTLREAIDTALLQNPDAVTARAGGPVSDATRVASSTYPWNPAIQVTVDPYARDQQGNFLATRNQVTLTQTLELAHQPRYRRRAADATWDQQKAAIAQSEMVAIAAGMRAYFDALYRHGLLNLAKNTADLQSRTISILDRRVKAGLSTPTERLTANVAARQSQRQATMAENDFQAALTTLRSTLGLTGVDQIDLGNDLNSYQWRPIADVLSTPTMDGLCDAAGSIDSPNVWIANRPDMIASTFAVAAAQANLALARANTVPNVATGPSYERDENGTVFFGVTAQMELPVWNTGCPLVRQRAAELRQQMILMRETRVRAELQAQAALRRYTRAYMAWARNLANVNSAANDIKTIQDSFEQGQATILEVLSIQDNLNQEQKNRLDILNEIAQAAIDAIAAMTIDPERLIEMPSGDLSGPAMNGASQCPPQ